MSPLDLTRLAAEQHLRRLAGATNGPPELMWFVRLQFAAPDWYRDPARVSAILDGLATIAWFRDLDVFAPGHVPGAPFQGVDEVRHLVATGEEATAMFARGEPRMTVDIEDAEAALALSIHHGHLEMRVWLGDLAVARHRGAVLGDLAALLVAWRAGWPDCVVQHASAFPDPLAVVRYPRTRPLRIANRAIDAVVDIHERDVPASGPPWVRDARAMLDAPVPAGVQREEHGPLVVLRWLDDPSDPTALAEACSRHEQWLVPLVATRIAEGWNAAGDLKVFEAPALVEATSDDAATWGRPRAKRPTALVVDSRDRAIALRDRALAAGFARVLYRDVGGGLWDPYPPGEWVG